MIMKKHIIAASLMVSAMTSFGAGYQLNLQGLRQLAMGGTGSAWAWDASTIFYNPAGLVNIKGIQVYGSALTIMPTTAYGNRTSSGTEPASETSVRRTFVPFNFYLGGQLHEDSRFALGLGIYTPFGTGLTWNDNWLGKYIVQSIDLQSVFFQPTISFRAADWLSVGAGFVVGVGSMDFRKALPVHGQLGPAMDDGTAHLHGTGTGVGFNAGVQIKASDDLRIGISYRSQVNMDLNSGTAKFKVPASLADSFPNTTFSARLPLPGTLTVGAGYRVGDVTLQLDLCYTGWNSYDSLRFDFATTTSALQNVREPRHYRNTFTPRLGVNYKVSKRVQLMAGGAYDPTPVTNGFVSPDLPDADRIVLTCGMSVRPLPGLTLMAALESVTAVKRNGQYDYAGFGGVYKTAAVTPGVGLYYIF